MKKLKGRRLFIAVGLTVITLIAGVTLTTNTAAAQQVSKPIYVALGDSFASGQGSGLFAEDTSVYAAGTGASGNECYRASSAYPELVAHSKNYTLINATCGGATTADVLNPLVRTTGQGNVVPIPAQIDSVPANANVVSLTIGGNDAQFVPFVSCVVNNLNPSPPCTESSAATQATLAALSSLQSQVLTVINAVKAKAPGAKVIVTGYPRVVTESANLLDSRSNGCFPWLTGGEGQLSNVINRGVNTAVQGAAAAAGATYVDISTTKVDLRKVDQRRARQSQYERSTEQRSDQHRRPSTRTIKASGLSPDWSAQSLK